MRIALISDIHGNLEALKTVLDDIRSKNIDAIYCLGDIIAKGSHPQECIDLIRENCDVVIRGNCDDYYSKEWDLSELSPLQVERIQWNQSMLSSESIGYLRNLPFCHEFYMSGRLIRLVHAHPERIYKFAGNIDTIGHLYELFLPTEHTISQEKADVLIYGHVHMPYVQKLYNRFIINVGSVGNSLDVFRNPEKDGNVKATTIANYLILSGNMDSKNWDDSFSFELVNVSYDIEKELSTSQDNVELEAYTEELRNGLYRNINTILDSFESRGIDPDEI